MSNFHVICGDALTELRKMPSGSVDCCVTSPPYYGLRNYGIEGQIGLEKSPEAYVARLVEVFREVRRVLANDGTLWLNLGDSYAAGKTGRADADRPNGSLHAIGSRGGNSEKLIESTQGAKQRPVPCGLKPKDLIGIPWRMAFALQADGWYLRSDIIWCLSGGTWLYVRTKKGDMPMMVKDAARLDPSTVKLWNGRKWTQVLGWSRSERTASELEIVLGSGERISCTPSHQFPSGRGLLAASELVVGDKLISVTLPEPEHAKRPEHIGIDAAWLAGLYLAEGSRSDDTIQIAGHADQADRFEKVAAIAMSYGGSATVSIDGNTQSIRVYGRLLVALIDELVSGRVAADKCINPICWRYDNLFLRALLEGYLSGDGHWDAANNRWRLGFTRNYNLERDLRVIAARLGLTLRLKPTTTEAFGKIWPIFKGEIRFERSGHHNEKDPCEIVAIRRSRCRYVYDVGVEDDPHVFALASGVLTHNSKPNPMPESVTDRPTRSHEYIFLFAKSERYYYDHESVKEPAVSTHSSGNGFKRDCQLSYSDENGPRGNEQQWRPTGRSGVNAFRGQGHFRESFSGPANREGRDMRDVGASDTRNKRDVWHVSTKPYPEAHFATFPEELIAPCILAGCREGGVVVDPFSGAATTGVVALKASRNFIGIELSPKYVAMARRRLHGVAPLIHQEVAS